MNKRSSPSVSGNIDATCNPPLAERRLTLDQAVKLIAPRMKKAGEARRGTEDRVRKQVSRAIKSGKLVVGADKTILARELGLWLRINRHTVGRFNDWPNREPITGSIDASLPTVAIGRFEGIVFPSTVPDCHALISQLIIERAALEDEVISLRNDATAIRD